MASAAGPTAIFSASVLPIDPIDNLTPDEINRIKLALATDPNSIMIISKNFSIMKQFALHETSFIEGLSRGDAVDLRNLCETQFVAMIKKHFPLQQHHILNLWMPSSGGGFQLLVLQAKLARAGYKVMWKIADSTYNDQPRVANRLILLFNKLWPDSSIDVYASNAILNRCLFPQGIFAIDDGQRLTMGLSAQRKSELEQQFDCFSLTIRDQEEVIYLKSDVSGAKPTATCAYFLYGDVQEEITIDGAPKPKQEAKEGNPVVAFYASLSQTDRAAELAAVQARRAEILKKLGQI